MVFSSALSRAAATRRLIHTSALRQATTLTAGFPRVSQRVCRAHRFALEGSYLISRAPVALQVRRRVQRSCSLLAACGVLTDGLQVTLIPGDGIGQEITQSVKDIFEHVNAPIEWEQYDVSGVSSAGEPLFRQAMDSLKRNRVGLKGQHTNFTRFPSRVTQRVHVQAFSSHPSLRPVTSLGTSPCVSSSTFTRLSSCASRCLAIPPVMTTSTSLSSARTLRASTLVSSTRATRVLSRT